MANQNISFFFGTKEGKAQGKKLRN